MADDVTVDNGSGTDYDVATDDDGAGNHVQIVKLAYSADGGRTPIPADADGLLVNLGANNDVTVTSGSVTADTELTTADLDTGAGTDTRAVVGIAGTASGGAQLIPGSSTDGLLVNLGANNDVTVSGVATAANQSTIIGHVDGIEGLLTTIDADTSNLSVVGGGTEAAAIRVTIANNSTGVLSVDDNGGALTVDNGGTFATQVDGAALTALQKIDDPVLVDDAAFTPATSSVMMSGFEADESSTDSVDEGDAGAARMTLDRKQIVTPQPHTTGGLSIFRSLDLDETEEDVKTSAGTVWGWYIANTATSTRFVKFYNATAANVTVGTTTPVLTLPIPGNSSDDIAANALGGMGITFDTAICVAATTGVADNDTGAPAANDVIVNIFYK